MMRCIQISNFNSRAQCIQKLHPFEIFDVSGNFDKKGVALSNLVHVKCMQYFSCVRYNIEGWQVNQKGVLMSNINFILSLLIPETSY